MSKVRYEISSTENKKVIKKRLLAQEEQLKELLSTLPTLKKHGLAGEIQSKVKQLRSGRKSKSFTLKLTRKFFDVELDQEGKVAKIIKEISVEAPVEKAADKYAVMRALKEQVIKKVKERRKARRPVIEQHSFDHNFSVPYMDFTYLEKESILKAMFKKIRFNMKNSKSPTDPKARYVGVEIELASKETREVLCDAIFDAGIGKHVCVKSDASIGSSDRAEVQSKLLASFPNSHEICILAKENEIEDVINKLCKVLNEVLHCSVDKTCGLHVHLDMRNRDPKHAFHNLVLSQQFLYAMLPAQRRNSRYSIPIKGPEWRDQPEHRYHGVNADSYRKYKTLELRMHCGTTNANKINNWIKLGIAICDAPKFKTAPTTIQAFKAAANLSDSLVDYVKSRIAKFAEQHKKTVPSAEQPGTMPTIDPVLDAPVDMSAQEDSEVA